MKYAGQAFTLYHNEPVAIRGAESLYTYQNTGIGTGLLQGSNNGINWVTITSVLSNACVICNHSYGFLRMTGSTEVVVCRGISGSLVDGLQVSGTATSAAVLFTTSMVGYESITVQVTSAGTSSTVIYETSDDNTNWVSCSGLLVNATGTTASATSTTTTGASQFARRCLYFRARVSTYGSGTVSVVGTLSKNPVNTAMPSFYGAYTETGTLAGGLFGTALESRTASKSSVNSGGAVRPISTVDGRQITRLNSIPENEWRYAAASGGIVSTSDVGLVAAAGASIKNYLTDISLANPSAVATEVVIKDGSTVVWRTYLAANAPLQSVHFVTPIVSSANAALNVACITTGTQTYVNAGGYKAP